MQVIGQVFKEVGENIKNVKTKNPTCAKNT